MRAAVFHEPRRVEAGDRPDAGLREPTDAVVRVVLACVCGTDLWFYRGDSPFQPGPIGHEFIGVVEDVGAEVQQISKGDLVIASFMFCDNTCPHCRHGIVYAFAPMWATLAEHARLFAVDLPGFGASERRADLLSPRAMGGFLARLVAEADLGRAHIVAPDVGTSAALFAAAAHPERFASVVVGTGGAAVPLELGEPLRSWVLDPDLDKYRRMDPRAIVDTAVDTIAGGIPGHIRDDYRACYAGDRFVESMRYVRRYPEELPELAELLPRIATPVTIVNGRHDRVVPPANAEFLDERLPTSRVVLIDAGHFVWEEAPAEYAAIVLDSITGSRS